MSRSRSSVATIHYKESFAVLAKASFTNKKKGHPGQSWTTLIKSNFCTHITQTRILNSYQEQLTCKVKSYQQTATTISKRMEEIDLPQYFNFSNQEVEGEDYKI
jgi:hypothetical protein